MYLLQRLLRTHQRRELRGVYEARHEATRTKERLFGEFEGACLLEGGRRLRLRGHEPLIEWQLPSWRPLPSLQEYEDQRQKI